MESTLEEIEQITEGSQSHFQKFSLRGKSVDKDCQLILFHPTASNHLSDFNGQILSQIDTRVALQSG